MSVHRFRYWSLKILSLWGLALIAFLLPHLLPGSPLTLYEPWPNDPVLRARLVAAYGFDRPLAVQYLVWMRRVSSGQWGYSRFYQRAVFTDILRAAGLSVVFLLWTVVAYALWRILIYGIDRVLRCFRLSLSFGKQLVWLEAIPKFLVAIVVHNLAVWRLGWTSLLPIGLFTPSHYLNPLVMLLPASVLALVPLSLWYAHAQTVACVQHATVWERWLLSVRRHCLLVRPLLGYLFMEACLTEHVFGLPGLGRFGIDALRRRDFPAIQGFILGAGILYVLLLLVLDWGTGQRSQPRSLATPSPEGWRYRQTLYGAAWGVIVLVALVIWAPHLHLHDPTEIHTYDQLLWPNARYILGTDFLGRDVFSRTVEGFRTSMPRIGYSIGFIVIASGLFFGLKQLLPVALQQAWRNSLACFEALPTFLLGLLTFLVVERHGWPLEVVLTVSCLPLACQMTLVATSLFYRLAALAYLAELMLLLDVSFFYLNLSPEPLSPTWGGDLRIGTNYSHLNIWLLLAPALAVTWSRYIFHRLGIHNPLIERASPCPVGPVAMVSEDVEEGTGLPQP